MNACRYFILKFSIQVCNVENDDLSKLSDLLRSQPDKRQQLQLVKILSASELSSSLQLSVSYISINRSLPASCYFCPTKKFDSCRDLFTHLCETQHLDLLNCVKCGSQQSSVVAYHDHLINQNCTAAPPAEDSVMLDFIRSSFVDGLSTTKSGKSAKDKRKIKSSNNPRISCDLCGKSYKENQWNSHDCAISYTRRLLVDNKVVKCPAVTFTPSKVDCCASGCFEVPQKMLAWLSRNVILPLILTKDVSLCDCPLKKSTENINVRSCGRELKKESDSEPNMLNCPKWRLKKNLTKAEERNEEVEESKEANLSEETASNDSSENFFEKIEAEVKRSLEFLKEKQSDKTGQNPPGKMLNDQKLTEEKSILHEEKQLNVAGKSDFDIVGLTPADSMSETQSQAEAAEHLLAKEKSAENRPVAPLCAKLPIQICEVFSLAPPEEDVDENSPLITDAEMVDTNSELSAVPQLSPPVSAVLVPSLSEIKPTCSYAGAPLPGMESGSYQLTVLPQNLIPSRLQTDFAAVISPSDARIGPHYLISGAGAKEALLSENRWIQTSIDPLVATDGLAALADGCPSHLPCQITSTTCTVCRVEQKSRELLALHMKQKHVLLCGKCTVCFVSESCLTAHREICQKNPVDLIGMMFWCPRCPKSFNDLGHYYIHLIEIHPDKVRYVSRVVEWR